MLRLNLLKTELRLNQLVSSQSFLLQWLSSINQPLQPESEILSLLFSCLSQEVPGQYLYLPSISGACHASYIWILCPQKKFFLRLEIWLSGYVKWLLLQRTLVQILASTWQVAPVCNFSSRAIWQPFLASLGSRLVCGAQTYMKARQPHTYNKNKSLRKFV